MFNNMRDVKEWIIGDTLYRYKNFGKSQLPRQIVGCNTICKSHEWIFFISYIEKKVW